VEEAVYREMKNSNELMRFVVHYILSAGVAAATIFYLLFHVMFGVPIVDLRAPFFAFLALHFAFLLANARFGVLERLRRGESRPFFVLFTAYVTGGCAGFVFFANRLGYFEQEETVLFYLTIAVVAPAGGALGHQLWHRFPAGRNRNVP
jgi:hypothetical protein